MITMKDFRDAKKAIKGMIDTSKAHRVAMDILKDRHPNANLELIQDMGWQIVMASRG